MKDCCKARSQKKEEKPKGREGKKTDLTLKQGEDEITYRKEGRTSEVALWHVSHSQSVSYRPSTEPKGYLVHRI